MNIMHSYVHIYDRMNEAMHIWPLDLKDYNII